MKAKILIPLLLTACMQQGVLHYEMRSLPEDGWRRQDTITFAVDDYDSIAMSGYSTNLCVRLYRAFPYDTLWLRVNNDTVPVPIAALHGSDLLQGEVPLPAHHTTLLRINHIMRRETLPHVRELGIRVLENLQER